MFIIFVSNIIYFQVSRTSYFEKNSSQHCFVFLFHCRITSIYKIGDRKNSPTNSTAIPLWNSNRKSDEGRYALRA